jgi:hypothetical protein
MSGRRSHSGSAAHATHKKAWWETWWGVIATTVIAGLIVWGITRYFDSPTPVLPPISASPPSPSVPIVKTPKPTPPPPSVKIDQRGNSNGAIGGNVTQGPCSVLQNGGTNNQAAVNCAPVERHLSEQQKAALRSLVIPESIKATLTMTNEGDSPKYGDEIFNALNLPRANADLSLVWGAPGPPQGVTVRIHDPNEPQILIDFCRALAKILMAPCGIDSRVPSGEVHTVVGRDP